MMNQLSVIQAGQGRRRKKRSPFFPVAGTMKPFGLYPFFAHPVLPGETLKNIDAKMRIVSQPVNNPLAGVWFEAWFVYVKLTDIDETLGEMFVSDSVSATSYQAGEDQARYFTKTGQIEWIKLATERVHDAFFLDDDETAKTIDGVRKVRMNSVSWAQNMIFEQANEAPGTTDIGELGQQLQYWQMMQQMSMSELSYDDYLKQYGVTSVRRKARDPEILRYYRKWVLPKNAIEPSTGAPSAAWINYDDITLAKDKRFDEPGFVLGLMSVRPKMYQKHLAYSMVGELWGFSDWFPIYNIDDPAASAKVISSANGVFHADHRTDVGDVDLVYDHKDLLMHGEQFVNNWSPGYALPSSAGMLAQDASTVQDLRGLYADDTSIDALFSGTNKFLDFEGMVSVSMMGHLTDTTPNG